MKIQIFSLAYKVTQIFHQAKFISILIISKNTYIFALTINLKKLSF